MRMKTDTLITVVNETGKKVDLELIDTIRIDEDEYVIVGPKDSDEAYAYKATIKNGQKEYFSIGQGAEFKRVLDKYNQQ